MSNVEDKYDLFYKIFIFYFESCFPVIIQKHINSKKSWMLDSREKSEANIL